MHNNYYFLRRLAASLHEKVHGSQITDLFSQNKDELIIEVDQHSGFFYIKASLVPDFSCLSFPENFQRAKKNSAEIFPEIKGLEIISIQSVVFDRSFHIDLESNYQLLFKMHGNRSNVLLMHYGECVGLFKNNMKADRKITVSSLERHLSITKERFLEVAGNLRVFLPVLGKSFNTFFDQHDYPGKSLESQWQIVQGLIQTLEKPVFYCCENNGLPTFRLIPCHQKTLFKTRDPIEAINDFYGLFIKKYSLKKEKNDALQPLEKTLKKTESYIQKAESKLELLKNETHYDQLANIIMANLNQFKTGTEKIILHNFYNGGTIEVQLKPHQTPQKLAEQYYRKAKNQKIEIQTLSNNIEIKKKNATAARRLIHDIDKAENIKDLRALLQHQKGIPSEDLDKTLPYHKFVYAGYTICVGKNASKNDLLTFKFATKDDLWLHVKDATGSHVVVKQLPGRKFPESVIEKAAELAAYFSKRKQETVCPVSYTFKKYVRKPKGARPGEVAIEKEKVILVKPQY